jgi:Kdo2-lipid IVA lauroyltransferase/acyltransferase
MDRGDAERQSRPKRRFRNFVEYSFYLVFSKITRLMGEQNVRRLGALVGTLANALVKRRTRLAEANLAMVFPEVPAQERGRIVRACWRHFCTMTLAYVRDSSIPFEQVATGFEVVGREHFEEALAGDTAVLLLSAHFGAWEAALSVLTSFGRKITVVGRQLDNPKLQERLVEGRTRGGIELLDRRNAARELVRAIREKAIVVLLIDQAVQSHEGEKVPFFGHLAWTTTSPARMAVKYRVPISTVFTYPPRAGVKGRLEFEPMITPSSLAGEELEPARIMQRVNERIEARIRRDPGIWLWFHDRWKGAGEPAQAACSTEGGNR